jgi:hypothetical protein
LPCRFSRTGHGKSPTISSFSSFATWHCAAVRVRGLFLHAFED